jgi:hypothetical protein
MKKLILLLFGILSFGLSFGQTNFKWEKTDSVAKTKEQIYSDTKMFIAEKWKSAKDVIQNDDKETGVILVKGLIEESISGTYIFVYGYAVKFLMKENKYKIIIEDVHCEMSYNNKGGVSYSCVDVFDGEDYKDKGAFNTSVLPKKYAIKMMTSLKADLQKVFDDYVKYIKAPSSTSGEW